MSENYRDICELDESESGDGTAGDLNNPEGISQAPSTPFNFAGDLGITGFPNAIDNIRNPNSNLGENTSSPSIEITRGNIASASRQVLMIPQQYVYNFPTANLHGYGLVGLRGINLDQRNFRQKLPPVPSMNSSDYVTAGENFEVVSTVAPAQDTLRYITGKFFFSQSGQKIGDDNVAILEGRYRHSFLRLAIGGDISSDRNTAAETHRTDSSGFNAYAQPNIFIQCCTNLPRTYYRQERRAGAEVQIFDGIGITVDISTTKSQSAISGQIGQADNHITTVEMEDYIKSFVPDDDKVFEGGPVVFDAAFFKPELNFIELPPAVYAGVKVNFPKESELSVYEMESILEFANNDYYQVRSDARVGKQNLYSTILRQGPRELGLFTEPGPDGAPLPIGTPGNREECNVVEKYSSHRVFLMQQTNPQLEQFIDQESQDPSRLTVLQSLSPISVELEFANPGYVDPEIASSKISRVPKLMVDHGLDSLVVAFLDKGFSDENFPNTVIDRVRRERGDLRSLFDSPYALDLSQDFIDETINEDDFYSESNMAGDAYMSPNEKLILNYRPRVYHDFLNKMYGFFILLDDPAVVGDHESAKTMRGLFGNLLEFPLLFENSDEYIEENDGKIFLTTSNLKLRQWHQSLNSNIGEFRVALNDLLFGEQDDIEAHIPHNIGELFGHADSDSMLQSSVPIAYRIEKVNSFTGKVLKEFYLFNNPDIETIKFYDSEALPSDRIRYNFYSVNFVADYEYSYEDTKAAHEWTNRGKHQRLAGPVSLDDPARMRTWSDSGEADLYYTEGLNERNREALPTVRTTIRIKPVYKIIESPFFSQEVSIFDHPPLPPSVSLDKIERNENGDQEFRIRFTSQIGKRFEEPIRILDSDEEVITKMYADQFLTLPPEIDRSMIEYVSDTLVQEYEVFILSEPPLGYESFRESDSHSFSGQAPFFTFPAPKNEPRYMIFRAKDKGGFSNPTRIYKFLFSSYGDGEFYEFDIYEPENEILRQPLEMGLERLLSLEPSLDQGIFRFDTGFNENGEITKLDKNSTPSEIRRFLENPPSSIESGVTLGHVDGLDSIWDKKFKIRLISKSTGRAIDFNIEYLLQRTDETVSENYETRSNRFEDAECTDTVQEKNARINKMIEKSNEKLKQTLAEASGDGSSSNNYDN